MDWWTARVVSVGLVIVDQDLAAKRSLHQLINPGISIPSSATQVHGITDADVAESPSFALVARRLRSMLDGAVVIGYNVKFDIKVINAEFKRAGLPVLGNVSFIDSYHIFCKHEPRNLTRALQYYCGRDHVGAHDALADAEATLDVLRAQLVREQSDAAAFVQSFPTNSGYSPATKASGAAGAG